MLIQNVMVKANVLAEKCINNNVNKGPFIQLTQPAKDTVSFKGVEPDYKEAIEQLGLSLYQSVTFPNYEQTFNNAAVQLIKVYDRLDESLQKKVKHLFEFIIENAPFDPARSIAIKFFYNKDKDQDPDLAKLVQLAAKVNQFPQPEGKDYETARENLLRQEFKILYQELTQPVKYLDRALKMGVLDFLPGENDLNDINDMMHQKALAGLNGMILMFNNLNLEMDPVEKAGIVDNLVEIIDSKVKTEISENVKYNSFNLLMLMYPSLDRSQKDKVDAIASKNLSDPESAGVSDLIPSFVLTTLDQKHPLRTQFEMLMLDQLKETANKPDQKRMILIGLTKLKSSGVIAELQQLLNDKEAKQKLKVTAIWAAGVYKEESLFDKVAEIVETNAFAKYVNKEDTELTEMALSSLSEYSNDRALDILNRVKNSESQFNELASALLDKLNGAMESEKDYILNQSTLSDSEKEQYKALRDKYIPRFDTILTQEEQNWVDKALVPFKTVLQEQLSKNRSFFVINDSPTAINRIDRAIRNFVGFFSETSGGQTTLKGDVVIPRYNFTIPSTGNYVLGHEFGHVMYHHLAEFDQPVCKKVLSMYQTASRMGNTLDHYAATSASEYMAQCNEAYLSLYKPHIELIHNNDPENIAFHTKSTLKRKDPEMYKFIDNLYKTYSQKPLKEVKPVNLFA